MFQKTSQTYTISLCKLAPFNFFSFPICPQFIISRKFYGEKPDTNRGFANSKTGYVSTYHEKYGNSGKFL